LAGDRPQTPLGDLIQRSPRPLSWILEGRGKEGKEGKGRRRDLVIKDRDSEEKERERIYGAGFWSVCHGY